MEERSFTLFPKVLRIAESIPDQTMRGDFLMAVLSYGARGVEPDLSWPLDALFEGVREDIDNSLSQRYRNRGGRPRSGGADRVAEDAATGCETEEETSVPDDRNPGFEDGANAKTGVLDAENPGSDNGADGKTGVSGHAAGRKPIPSHTKPGHTKPSQSRPGHAKPGHAKRERPAVFQPPTIEEVADLVRRKHYGFSPEAFVAHYESVGWKVGKTQMRDWRAACRAWQARDEEGSRAADDEYSEL